MGELETDAGWDAPPEAYPTQQSLLHEVASGAPLAILLEHMVLAIERLAPGMTASVLLLEEGRLRYAAAPHLPEAYNRAADQHPIGEGFGSCGTAAHRRQLVIVEDIQSDPLWKNYREIARRYRLGACWSMPIFDSNQSVVGTFALYYHDVRRPRSDELDLIQGFSRLAALAIEQHRTRQALLSREHAQRELLEDLNAIAWESSPDRRQFTFVSDNAERVLGHPLERWREPGFWQSLLHPEDRETTLSHQVTATGDIPGKHVSEYRVLAADGRTVWLRDIVHADHEGPLARARVRGVMVDISRQREAEQEREGMLRRLGDEQSLLRTVVHQMPEAVIVASAPEGRVLVANAAAERILPMTVLRAADAASPLAQGWTILGALGRGERLENRELELLGTDGQRRTMRLRTGPLQDKQQRLVAGVAVLSDVTERRRADASQRLLADAGSLVGGSLDPQLNARNLAELVAREFADWCVVFTRGDRGVVRCAALVHRDPAHQAAAAELERLATQAGGLPFGVSSLLAGGQPQIFHDLDLEAFPPGALRPELLRLVRRLGAGSALAVPLRIRERTLGALVFVLASGERGYGEADLSVAEELAHRMSLALENARLFDEAQSAIKQREEFLSIAAHELKTPVASMQLTIQSMADVLSSPTPDLEFLRGRTIAGERQGARLARLVDELLDVSTIQAGQMPLSPEDMDLVAAIHAAVARFRDELSRRSVDVAVHAPEPVVGHWDPMRIEQVLTNLVSNAIKYGEGRPVNIQVQADDRVARVTVADEGIGMSAELIGRLWRPFERGVSAGHYGGLGLGLYITEQIVSAHGGQVSVRSTPGEGTAFSVELPRQRMT